MLWILLIIVILFPSISTAAITDTGNKVEAIGNDSGGAGFTFSFTSTTAGNSIVVTWTASRASTTPNCQISDTSGNTYTTPVSQYLSPIAVCASVGYLTTGGTLSITVKGNGTNSWPIYVAAHEFTGVVSTSPVSGTPIGASASASSTVDTGSFTPSDSNTLYIAYMGDNNSGTITPNQAPGNTDWTESNQHSSAGGQDGSLVYYINSGSAVARRSVWSKAVSTTWSTLIFAVKEAAVSTSRQSCLLLGVC